jgi:hypothetical protein
MLGTPLRDSANKIESNQGSDEYDAASTFSGIRIFCNTTHLTLRSALAYRAQVNLIVFYRR